MVAEKNRVWRLARDQGNDTFQGMDEAEVEHLVGLVENEDLKARGRLSARWSTEVEQAARRCD